MTKDEALAQPEPPPECQTEAEKTAFAFGWFKAMEAQRLAQPEQKYRRGDRLVCLETDEYCVIHIAGTDRQWVKFPDTHIGVYTNEQVDKLFEKLTKETDSAQPEQEPVAWHEPDAYGNVTTHKDWALANGWQPLYTHPQPKREWVGLTDEEIQELHYQVKVKGMGVYRTEDIYRAVEAKLKEKNNG